MITLDELCTIISTLGILWANENFEENETPQPPYIVLQAGFEETVYADNRPYVRWMTYELLLYTKQRDYALESRIEAALDGASIAYSKSVAHDDGESLIEACYTVNVTE